MSQPKIILITGASAGFGKATAEMLATEGAKLILCGRREDRLHAVAASLKTPTLVLPMDVRNHAATLAALASLPAEWQAIDVLINNAGLALGLEPFEQVDFDDMETMVETNILGLLTLTHAILPGMKQRKRGHIVNIASTAGNYAYAGGHVYGASKAFVTHFSMGLRADLLGSPVRVTNIEPGMADTEFSLVRFKGDTARAESVYAGVAPLTAQDIAETIRWVLTQPPHVNINRIEMMPVMQAPAGLAVHRTED